MWTEKQRLFFAVCREFNIDQNVKGVLSAAAFGTLLSISMEDGKFSYRAPANLLPLILAFFSFLSFTCSPFLLFLFRVQMNALP